jgi:putative cell wall-binding protein
VPEPTLDELKRLKPSTILVMGGTGAISNAVLTQLQAYAGTVTRVSGSDRYLTSVGLSGSTFSAGGPKTVYIATGQAFPDGLSAGPVAGLRGGPLLLVPRTSLPSSVAAELKRLDPTNVVIIGGTGAVSETVRNQIRAIWP